MVTSSPTCVLACLENLRVDITAARLAAAPAAVSGCPSAPPRLVRLHGSPYAPTGLTPSALSN